MTARAAGGPVRRSLSCAAAMAALALAACATAPAPRPVAASHPPASHRTTAPHGRPAPVAPVAEAALPRPPAPFTAPQTEGSVADLPGWGEEDHAAALRAFVQACGVSREAPMQAACAEARAGGPMGEAQARRWFERRFRPAPLQGEGVLTAYFAPQYPARFAPDAEFSAPVRPKPYAAAFVSAPPAPSGVADPMDLLDDPQPSPAAPPSAVSLATADRATIESAPADAALAWMRPEDLFFLQIQGSGVLVMDDGRRMKALYAGDNGRPFTAIARPMVQEGILARDRASGDTIRAWLHDHAGRAAQAMMARNARYVFFNTIPDDGREPAGAAGQPLPPGRALAVDPGRHAYGELYWIDAEAPVLAGAARRYRRLALALDTGAAIRGEVRADLYVGSGAEAGREAGRVRHTLRMVRLVPVEPGG